MFGPQIESFAKKEWSHSVFSPLPSAGVAAQQLEYLLGRFEFARLAKAADLRRPARLRHGISRECPSSRHIFLKNAASAKIILRFELSHKSGSNLFQNFADSIDIERRPYYVLQHRMRAACVFVSVHPDASFFSVSANKRECDMYHINSIASACVACSCREAITGKTSTLRRM